MHVLLLLQCSSSIHATHDKVYYSGMINFIVMVTLGEALLVSYGICRDWDS